MDFQASNFFLLLLLACLAAGGFLLFKFLRKGQSGNFSSTPALDGFSRDLTGLAALGNLDPVIGRKEEISHLIMILSRRTKNNAVLVGNAGVGKTAIAEGLAQNIVQKKAPLELFNKRILALDLNALIAGTKYRENLRKESKGLPARFPVRGGILFFSLTKSKI